MVLSFPIHTKHYTHYLGITPWVYTKHNITLKNMEHTARSQEQHCYHIILFERQSYHIIPFDLYQFDLF